MQKKVCKRCGKELELNLFYKKTSKKDGLTIYCKSCTTIEHKKYNELNKEATRLTKLKYNEVNKEARLRQHKEYHSKNKDKYVIWEQNRRARKLSLPNNLTSNQWEIIKECFNNECAYCGKQKPLVQEHFLALSNNGEYTVNNIIPSCQGCNCSKGNKYFYEWYPKYKCYNAKREKTILKFLHYNKNNEQQLAFTI